MVPHDQTAFPLRDVNKAELQQLCKALWGWSLCAACETRSRLSQYLNCQDTYCFRRQPFDGLNLFLEFYKQVTSSYVPELFDPDDQALRSHQDLFDIISVLRDHGEHLNREECREICYSTRRRRNNVKEGFGLCHIPLADRERALNIAVTIMTMVRTNSLSDVFGTPSFDIVPSDEEQGRTMLQEITSPLLWGPEQTLHEALLDAFPSRIHPSLQPTDPQSKTIVSELTAINLTKIAKLRFVGTSDLRNHLRLDPVSGTVHIFHHTSFLKQHLLSSKRTIESQVRREQNPTANLESTPSSQSQQQNEPTYPGQDAEQHPPCKDSLEPDPEPHSQNGPTPKTGAGFIFPRSLALETFQTLKILFPPPSHPQFAQCQSLLRSLVAKSNFDPDILNFGITAYQLPFESNTTPQPNKPYGEVSNPSPSQRPGHGYYSSGSSSAYPIWGTRLMALYAELEDPTPRGILDNWLERRSKSRHVMMVTLAGVTVAIILGILSLGVSIFQAWISWQEWKHPV